MKRLCAVALGMVLLLLACGKDEPPPTPELTIDVDSLSQLPLRAHEYLPPSDSAAHVTRLGEPAVVRPNEAESRLGALLDDYLAYGFVGLGEASYDVRGIPVTVEIAQFGDLKTAYGFYALARPVGVSTGSLGGESYESGPHLYFTGKEFVVTISVEGTAPKELRARDLLAAVINEALDTNKQPPFFLFFPAAHKVGTSQQYAPFNFAGVAGLDDVYSNLYEIESDTAVLFLTVDRSGEKFLHLQEYGEAVDGVEAASALIEYEGGHGLTFEAPGKGRITAGLVQGKLVGVVGYRDSFERLLALWVKGFK